VIFEVMDVQRSNVEDQENRLPKFGGRSKMSENFTQANINNGQQRSSLAVLSTQNATNIRRQPTRAAKQDITYGVNAKGCQDENAFARQANQKPVTSSSGNVFKSSTLEFTIYSDNTENTSKSSIASQVPAAADKTLLQYAAKQMQVPEPKRVLRELALPKGFTSLPSSQVSSGSEEVEMEDEDAMNISMPSDSRELSTESQEHLLKLREEEMYDMAEYAADIYEYLRCAEKEHRPRLNYMSKQTDISVSMRWILVDWMVEVAEEYKLKTETLYLAVSYIDRFLSHMAVKRDKLQLVGTTAMFIAAKYEEIYPPDVSQFAYITDNTYKVNHILRMEHLILKVLSFDMAVPTAHYFLTKFARKLRVHERVTHLALFLSELTMLDPDPFLKFLPSEIAATALAIANYTLELPAWPALMVETFGIRLEELRECYACLNAAFGKVHTAEQHAIRDKYRDDKYSCVSVLLARLDLPFSEAPAV